MKCLICNREVGPKGDASAISISTHGNFGSTILDNDGYINFSICDLCIIERQDRIRLRVQKSCAQCHQTTRGFELSPLPKGMIPKGIDTTGKYIWDKEPEDESGNN